MKEEVKEQLKKQAEKANRSMTSYIIDLIKRDSNIIQVPVIAQEAYENYLRNFPASDPRD